MAMVRCYEDTISRCMLENARNVKTTANAIILPVYLLGTEVDALGKI